MKIKPVQFVVISFATVILVGAILLWLPFSSADGHSAPFIDALFTATSATCVTGLVVRDTGTEWSLFGQLVILFLIQIGGLGYMTFATFIPLILGRRVGIVERMRIAATLGAPTLKGIMLLMRDVFWTVLIVEGIGALILFLHFLPLMSPLKALYFGIFHAVSAFCNAGIDVMGSFSGPFSSLTAFRGDLVVNLTICVLIVIGGIGFLVVQNILFHWRKKEPINLNTKVVLRMTAALLLVGTIAILAMEYSNPNTLGNIPLGEKILASFFQAVTPRTAGFNTIDIGAMNVATLISIVVLMFIGASPGGTGGGVKTSTIAILLATVRCTVRGFKDTVILGRRVDDLIIRKALSVVILAALLVGIVSLAISFIEPFTFVQLLFEVTSGFGTVGLSTGITPNLTIWGKALIIFTIFAGRVGPLTLISSLILRQKETRLKYPEEVITVG